MLITDGDKTSRFSFVSFCPSTFYIYPDSALSWWINTAEEKPGTFHDVFRHQLRLLLLNMLLFNQDVDSM